MKTIGLVGLVAGIALAGSVTNASAEYVSLQDLLAQGWQVVATTYIPAADVQRAMNNTQWVDDVLLTLQRGQGIAFCHESLQGTQSDDTLLSYNCHVPPIIPPAPPTANAVPPGTTTTTPSLPAQ